MEIDEVVVNSALWAKAKAGDADARKELGRQLTGIELYMHIMLWNPATDEIVTLRDLEGANVIDYVTIGAPFKPGIVIMRREDGTEVQVHTCDDGSRS